MTVLCYHSLDPHWQSQLAVPPRTFERHAGWLRRYRKVLPLAEAVGRMSRRGALPTGTSVLTFDDGFADNHVYGLPILRRFNLPATVFLVAQTLTAQGRPVDWIDDEPPGSLRTLTVEQVLELREAGVALGSHSWSHRDLTTLDYEACVNDLRDSRVFLEDLLHQPVPFLAYPRGRNNRMVRDAAKTAGYLNAFSLPERHEPVDGMAVPRVGVYPWNSLRTLWLKSQTPYLALRTSPAFPLLLRASGRVARVLGARSHRERNASGGPPSPTR